MKQEQTTHDKIRVGVVLGEPMSHTAYIALKDILSHGYHVPVVLIGPRDNRVAYKRQKKPRLFRPLWNDWSIIRMIADKLVKNSRVGLPKEHMKKYDPWEIVEREFRFEKIIVEKIEYTESGNYRNYISPRQINILADQCDILVLLTFNKIIRGEILHALKYGILSSHPADTFKHRGRPAGFFEWIEGEESLGVTVQRLNDTLDGGEVIAQRHVNLAHARSVKEAKQDLKSKSFYSGRPTIFVEAIQALEEAGKEAVFSIPKRSILHRQKDADRFVNTVRYLVRNIKARIRCE